MSGLPPGGKNSANFDSLNAADGGTTDVGAYVNSKSYYGTYDQVGNTWEWLEPDPLVDPATSRRRSGSWANALGRLNNTQTGKGPLDQGATEHQGFRIAGIVVAANPPQVSSRLAAGKIEITWTGQRLESTASVSGPWSTVNNAPNPLVVVPTDNVRFYRSAR